MPEAQVLPFPMELARPSVGSRASVPRVSWASHFDYLDRTVEPGQHVSIISPTGNGKTTLIVEGLMPLWRQADALLIDLKGDDPLLEKWGFKVTNFPSATQRWSLERRHRRRPPWYRLFVPGILSGVPLSRQRETVQRALMQTHKLSRKRVKKKLSGWVIITDETMALVDLKLDAYLRDLWQRGRTRRMTLIAATQEPRWIPRAMYSQPSHRYIGRIIDRDDQKRLAEIGGDSEQIRAAVARLGRWDFLYVGPGGDRVEVVNVRK